MAKNKNEGVRVIFAHHPGSTIWPGILILIPILALLGLAPVLTGCATTHSSAGRQPAKSEFATFQLTNGPSGPVTPTTLQQQIMRFADTYATTIAQASDDIALGTTNAQIREMMLRWKLQQATAAYNDATGPSPQVNALDILVLTTLAQDVVADYGVAHYGAIARPLLAAQNDMESNAWSLATTFLSLSQQMELRDLIREWRAKYPHSVEIGPVRFQQLAAALGKVPTEEKVKSGSIFGLLYLNPLARLDTTTAAIEGIRELGERSLFYAQRTPTLLNWQTQLLLYQLQGEPRSVQMESDFHRISLAAEAVGNTSKQLPQIINDQRQAAIQQILNGLVAQGNKSSELLTNAHSTIESAGKTATNIDSAIKSLTAFVQSVSPTNNRASPTRTNSHPFNVLDYGVAASQVGTAATNVQDLLLTANQSGQQLGEVSRQVTIHADHVVNHAFVLGVVMIFIFILLQGALALGLIYLVFAKMISHGGWKRGGAG